MSPRSEKRDEPPKRLNRTVAVGDAITGVLDPALRRRGFASRDILAHWGAMAPRPYDAVTRPDKLSWPRGEKAALGATLYLRCAEGHQLAVSHDGARIAAAINRYFGYVLVNEVRLAIEPLAATGEVPAPPPVANPIQRALVARAVNRVDDTGVREALRELGHRIATKRR